MDHERRGAGKTRSPFLFVAQLVAPHLAWHLGARAFAYRQCRPGHSRAARSALSPGTKAQKTIDGEWVMKAILLALLQTAAPGGIVGLVPAQAGAVPRKRR
jgi:hypothetical protein